jgi:pyruvate/2-oxoglutarate dehydrogenase complex dihydrolipoamide acyltransferase (E2) component
VSQHEFRLPELGEDAPDEATVSFWYFEEGEAVAKDEDLVEMLTDKATFNVPSPVSGTLTAIRVGDGEKAQVGDVLGVLATDE